MSPFRRVVVVVAIGLAMVLMATWVLTVAAGHRKATPPVSTSDPLDDLERRLSNLESTEEPFTVVDRQGKKIFSVVASPNGYSSNARVFNSNEMVVASMVATSDGGGIFTARTEGGSMSASLSTDQSWAGLRIGEDAKQTVTENGVTHDVTRNVARVELGGTEGGNYSLKFPGFAGLLAGIGESKKGTGLILVGDEGGIKRAQISVGDDGKGYIIIINKEGNAVAALQEAVGNSGGELAIGSAGGEGRVKMGTNDNRYGVVLTFPAGLPYVPKSGLPGSYMLGCAGGPSCQ